MAILKAKHWVVFMLFLLGYILTSFTGLDIILRGCILIAGIVLYVGWYILLGNALHGYLPRKAYYSLTWFLIDGFLIIVTYASAIILFDGIMEATGFASLLGLYLFFAIGHLFWFPAATLVAIEIGREPEFNEYGGTLLQLIVWPIGIWFIQPRLNRIYKAIQADMLNYPRGHKHQARI